MVDRWSRDDRNNPSKSIPLRLTKSFIEKVIAHCKSVGKITQRELLIKQTGQILLGASDEYLNSETYWYNPDNFPSLSGNDITFDTDGWPKLKEKRAAPSAYFVANQEVYQFPEAYLEPDDLEINPNAEDEN